MEKDKILSEVHKWMGGTDYTIVQLWEQDNTYFVVVWLSDKTIVCLRLWESVFTDTIRLSQDKVFDTVSE